MSKKFSRQRIHGDDYNVPIILVVEDEEDNLLYISHALIFLKYNFIAAKTGQAALDLATKYQVDLVLLDLVLPDISGFELVSLLRQNVSQPDMPIIATSALVRKQDRERAMLAGCDDYLSKPYSIDDLDRRVRHHLSQSFFSSESFWLVPF